MMGVKGMTLTMFQYEASSRVLFTFKSFMLSNFFLKLTTAARLFFTWPCITSVARDNVYIIHK